MRLSEVAAEVTRSSEYMEICSKLGGTALKTVGAKRHVVSKAIDIQRSKQESQYETDEDRALKLIQIMPYWLDAQVKLNNHKSDMSHKEIKKCKETVTTFNKIIRTMIDEEQCSSMKETMDSINEVMLMLNYTRSEIEYASQSFYAVIQGMRHEIAAESALNWTPGVELAEMTSTDDDDFCGRVLPEDRTIKSKCSYYEKKIKEIVAIERQRRSKAQRTLGRAV